MRNKIYRQMLWTLCVAVAICLVIIMSASVINFNAVLSMLNIKSTDDLMSAGDIHLITNRTDGHRVIGKVTKGPPTNLPKPVVYLTTKLIGRLGNKMFVYASLLGVAKLLGRVPFVRDGLDLDKVFQITHLNSTVNTSGWPVIKETGYASFNVKFMRLPEENYVIDGYLQCWRYFIHAQDEIRREFTLQPHLQQQVDSVLSKYRAELSNNILVGVHARRGDFVNEHNFKRGYRVPEGSYFANAFSRMRSILVGQNVTFLVASEDIEWCEKNINDTNTRFLPSADAATHFALLSSCDHMILSSGTFGWWAAWLANGISIYYKNFPPINTHLHKGFNENDYYPPGWIGLEN